MQIVIIILNHAKVLWYGSAVRNAFFSYHRIIFAGVTCRKEDAFLKSVCRSLDKIDGRSAVLGAPMYVEDLAPRDCLHVKLLRSPHAFARIRNIDIAAALAVEGVAAVYTYRDIEPVIHTIAAEAWPEGSPRDRVLLGRTVRFVGDPVAVVAAETELAALLARDSIVVDYEVLKPLLDFETALTSSTVIHEPEEVVCLLPADNDPAHNLAAGFIKKYNDADAVFPQCDAVVDEVYRTKAQMHATMETHRAFCTTDMRGNLVITSSCQSPFHVQRIVAEILQIPEHTVRVVKPKVGGAFGGKNSTLVEPFVALVTKRTGRPSLLVLDRQECFMATNTRHATAIRVKIGATAAGVIRAIRMEMLTNTGAYAEHCVDVLAVGCKNVLPMYKNVSAVEFYGKAAYSNTVPAGAFRGFGGAQSNYALESAVNELSHKLGMDPVEIRLRNIIREGDTHPFLAGSTPGKAGMVVSSTLDRCILRGMELIGWTENARPCFLNNHTVRAMGMCVGMHGSGIAGMDVVEAEVRFQYDGSYMVLTGASDLGTGGDTVLVQIAAEALDADPDEVNIVTADTAVTPYDKGAYASSTTYVTGNAVKRAAEKLRRNLIRAAELLLETERGAVTFDGLQFTAADGRFLTRMELARKAAYYTHGETLFGAEEFPSFSASSRYGGSTSPPPFVAGFAQVDVDLETGSVTPVRLACVADCGTVINPKLARIQLEGGLVQCMGYTLYEDVQYDRLGNLRNDSFTDYRIPTAGDIPEILTEFISSYEPTGPYGAKSLGEVVFHTPAAAIQDAIFNACGARVRDLPITPEKILAAIQKETA